MKLHAPVPVLRIFDQSAAVRHYIDFLGFKIDRTHRFGDNFPVYISVSRDGCVLHLSEHHGDCCPGARSRVQVDSLDKYHQELTEKDYNYAKPGIEQTPWGDREMCVSDPFGNRLTFYEKTA